MEFKYSETQLQIADMVRDFAEKHIRPDMIKWDEEQLFPVDIFMQMGELGSMGIITEEKYNGYYSGINKYYSVVAGSNRLSYTSARNNRRKSVQFLRKNIFTVLDYSNFCDFVKEEYGIKARFKCDKVDRLILNIYKNNEELLYIDAYEFEILVQRLMEMCEFEVLPTRRTRDGGYDMLLYKKGLVKLGVVGECKTTSKKRKVGVGALRELIHVVDDLKYNIGVLFTNYQFSAEAIRKAALNSFKIQLFDGRKIIQLINRYVNSFKNYSLIFSF